MKQPNYSGSRRQLTWYQWEKEHHPMFFEVFETVAGAILFMAMLFTVALFASV